VLVAAPDQPKWMSAKGGQMPDAGGRGGASEGRPKVRFSGSSPARRLNPNSPGFEPNGREDRSLEFRGAVTMGAKSEPSVPNAGRRLKGGGNSCPNKSR